MAEGYLDAKGRIWWGEEVDGKPRRPTWLTEWREPPEPEDEDDDVLVPRYDDDDGERR